MYSNRLLQQTSDQCRFEELEFFEQSKSKSHTRGEKYYRQQKLPGIKGRSQLLTREAGSNLQCDNETDFNSRASAEYLVQNSFSQNKSKQKKQCNLTPERSSNEGCIQYHFSEYGKSNNKSRVESDQYSKKERGNVVDGPVSRRPKPEQANDYEHTRRPKQQPKDFIINSQKSENAAKSHGIH